jgi:N-acetylmuramoyl-L-alanine amidase
VRLDDPGFSRGDCDPAIARAQGYLAAYGYNVEPTGVLDENTEKVLTAFQLHFRPRRVDGRLDRSTEATLERLVEASRRRNAA